MYLTRFEINSVRRGAKKLLGSPQAMHAAVLAAYPSSRSEGRVLWRVDRFGPHTWLYVVGPDKPQLRHLAEQAGWSENDTWQTRPYLPLLEQLEKGDRWAFRLTANPTHSVRIGDATRSQRIGHVTVAQQLRWFGDRATSWGVRLPETDHGPTVAVKDRRSWQFRRNGSLVTLSTATFDGELVVEDPVRLRQVLAAGIGPAKAYGCGLMTLAPTR